MSVPCPEHGAEGWQEGGNNPNFSSSPAGSPWSLLFLVMADLEMKVTVGFGEALRAILGMSLWLGQRRQLGKHTG